MSFICRGGGVSLFFIWGVTLVGKLAVDDGDLIARDRMTIFKLSTMLGVGRVRCMRSICRVLGKEEVIVDG